MYSYFKIHNLFTYDSTVLAMSAIEFFIIIFVGMYSIHRLTRATINYLDSV